jgi:hypothetical protein
VDFLLAKRPGVEVHDSQASGSFVFSREFERNPVRCGNGFAVYFIYICSRYILVIRFVLVAGTWQNDQRKLGKEFRTKLATITSMHPATCFGDVNTCPRQGRFETGSAGSPVAGSTQWGLAAVLENPDSHPAPRPPATTPTRYVD